MTRLSLALDQIALARKYTVRLLEHTDPSDWFRQPAESVSHIAWQVGHLAMAEYRLALERVRGRRSEDDELISEPFLFQFARSSVPDPDPAKYPSPAEIRCVFGRVHAQALAELPHLKEEELDRPVLKPHPLFDTKLGALLWCAQHEMLHAGQIGLLRRLLGQPPLW
jgi:hypothetical protein